MHSRTRINTLAALAGCAALVASARAPAQNALGDGRALDANSRVGSSGRNSVGRTLSSELQFRNAIVSGNAPAGISFRGDVGYTSPFDFRGELGSDDLFAFRRDSYFSGLTSVGGQGLRGVDALQFQLGLSLAGSFDATGPAPIITRTASPGGGRVDPQVVSLDASSNLFDPLATRPGALRATSEFVVGDALSPKLLGQGQREDGTRLFTLASPLRSISQDTTPWGVAQPFFAPAAQSDEPRPGEQDARVTGRIEPRKASQQVVLDALRAREGQRDEGAGEAPAQPEGEGVEAPGAPESFEQRLERLRLELEGAEQAPPAGEAPEGAAERVGRLTREALEGREAAVRNLAPAGEEPRDFFAEHMRRGQELLAADRWFEAEERFTSAVMAGDGDVFAQAGRLHAQIGAGLYRSATENLKELIRRHPEILAVRFDADLLPRTERLARVAGELRNRMAENSEFGRASALLLAYLGRQHDDAVAVREAFDAIARINKAIGEADPVFDAARAAWLDAAP